MKREFFFLILIGLFLISCTNRYEKNIVEEIVSQEETNKTFEVRNEEGVLEEKEDLGLMIIIENTTLKPNKIIISINETTEIYFENKDNLKYRIEIPMFKTEKQINVFPLETISVKLNPVLAGSYPIKLGQFTLGIILVE
jgi:hypothetical protein